MAEAKKNEGGSIQATPESDRKDPSATVAADLTGEVSNTPGGGGTIQLEPKPEDYPASAKVCPPAEQVNTAMSQAVGVAAVPEQSSRSPDSDAITEGGEAADKLVDKSTKLAQEIADKRRELNELQTA